MESASRNRVYLVTGGCGFLGQRLVQMLLEKEPDLAEVRVFDVRLDESMRQLDRGERLLHQHRISLHPQGLWDYMSLVNFRVLVE